MEIGIKDFQCLEDVALHIDEGLTVIVGPSNVGKSAVFRAIESAVYNRSSDTQIRAGKTKALVKVVMGDKVFVWMRDKTKSSKVAYKVGRAVYQKIGRGQLPVIGEEFGLKEIVVLNSKERLNFWKQMRFPFLLDKTGSQLFEFLSFSEEGYNVIAKNMKKDLQELVKDREEVVLETDILLEQIESTKERYESLKVLDPCREVLDKIRKPLIKYNIVKDCCLEIERLTKVITGLSCERDKQREAYIETRDFPKLVGEISGVETLSSRLGEIEELQKGIREFSEEIERFREKLLKYSVLGKLEGFDRKVEVYRKYIEGLTEAVAQIESVEEDLSTGREVLEFMYKEREGVLAELGEFKVCPLCGSSLEGV